MELTQLEVSLVEVKRQQSARSSESGSSGWKWQGQGGGDGEWFLGQWEGTHLPSMNLSHQASRYRLEAGT